METFNVKIKLYEGNGGIDPQNLPETLRRLATSLEALASDTLTSAEGMPTEGGLVIGGETVGLWYADFDDNGVIDVDRNYDGEFDLY